jgi:diaminopimelate decarboxylase
MLTSIATKKFYEIETPFFYYDLQLLQQTLEKITFFSKKYDFQVHYALKANANTEILELIYKAGLGADCVSGNEVLHAIKHHFLPKHIAFAGVGKTDKEITIALQYDIFSFNCESVPEIQVINALAKQQNKVAHIALRLNPNVEAHTHSYITTGKEGNKFGIHLHELVAVLDLLPQLAHIKLTGIHFHIGSQILNMDNFVNLCHRINEVQILFLDKNIDLQHLNVGGGLGINYQNPDAEPIADFENYFGVFAKHLNRLPHQEIHFELGRAIVGQCGSLISKVLYVKQSGGKQFIILDAGMTELIRPALYQAYHHIENMTSTATENHLYEVVGPVCESSDCFAKAIALPLTQRNDLIALRSAGAYGEVMSSAYNLREKAKAVYKLSN